jgi:hypothetical protein
VHDARTVRAYTPPVPQEPRHVSRGVAIAPWGWLALGVAVVIIGVVWASALLRRRVILFEAPFRIAPGASMTGYFKPDRRGPFDVQIRFREAWLETRSEVPRGGDAALSALAKDVGGGWHGDMSSPPGFIASYSVRAAGRPEVHGVTGKRLVGLFGPREGGVYVAEIEDGQRTPHEFHVRIDQAVEGLRKWEARLVVAASGDAIHFASVEVAARTAIAAVVVPLGLLGLRFLRARLDRKRSRDLLLARLNRMRSPGPLKA